MAVLVRIPAPLRKITNGLDKVDTECRNISECIEALNRKYPGIKERLCDDTGELRHFVNVYINGEDVRFLKGMETETKAGDEVSIVPAVAGG